MSIHGKWRAYLRRLGQTVPPSVFVGKAGITPPLQVQLEDAIQAHELVKCRVLPNAPAAPREIAEALAQDSRAELVGVVGRNFLIYRRSDKNPRIELPER